MAPPPCVPFPRFTALVPVAVVVLWVVAGSGLALLGNGVQPDSLAHHGNILSPLLKALSEQEPWGAAEPRTRPRPDSRYVRFMKRLYKLSSRPERSHETEQLYNTVRLITPRQECLSHSTDYFTQDISYSLDRVRAQEHLLKSVLLYSVNHNLAASLASICYLHVKEHMPSDDRFCLHPHSSSRLATAVTFHVRSERAGRRKWAEVDVTPFLQPLIRSHRKDLHLLLNLTCLEHGIHGRPGRSPLELSHVAPSLLLYLNDTSEVAYRRSSAHSRFGSFRSNHWDAKPLRHDHHSGSEQHTWRDRRSTLNSTQEPNTNLSSYEFPTDECDLYDVRVSFSQLKLDHWIIAPHKYNPRYCKGVCPRAVGYIYGSPVHTMVQNIIYEKLDSSIPRPSCVPSEYDPLSVLTIENDGSIAYKEYEEMIATKCTCR
ncbi:growth/differentiation factor 9 [Astyanax mexicanus]|uniref:growth/differentiation factor 9 n=1 Tax=Astyanax mexicanus TaxID=7994 RepID=UPI0020CAE93F|nr:growth/differentiation factor 9 [Astyanax mexicanus]